MAERREISAYEAPGWLQGQKCRPVQSGLTLLQPLLKPCFHSRAKTARTEGRMCLFDGDVCCLTGWVLIQVPGTNMNGNFQMQKTGVTLNPRVQSELLRQIQYILALFFSLIRSELMFSCMPLPASSLLEDNLTHRSSPSALSETGLIWWFSLVYAQKVSHELVFFYLCLRFPCKSTGITDVNVT